MRARDRRALIIGVAVSALSWLGLRGVPRTLAWLDTLEESVEQRMALLDRAQGRLALLPVLDDSIETLGSVADSLPSMLLAADEREGAEVELMTRLRGLVEDGRAEIRQFEPAELRLRAEPLTLAAVQVMVESDFRGLMALVRMTESQPALAVESIEVTAADPHGADSVEVLSAQIVVTGWFGDGLTGDEASASEVQR